MSVANNTNATAGKTNRANKRISLIFFFSPLFPPIRNGGYLDVSSVHVTPIFISYLIYVYSFLTQKFLQLNDTFHSSTCCPELLEELCYFFSTHIAQHICLQNRTTLIIICCRCNCMNPSICFAF